MTVWLDGAERIPGRHSSGGDMVGGNCLLTHHITVSGKTSYAGTRDYLVREGFEPTLLLDSWGGHRGQFLPADRSAFALMHPTGHPQTNREGRIHIQVEWLCPDMNTDLSAAPHFAEQWHDLCVFAHALGVPYVWTFGGPLATSRDPQTWKKPGHRGHRNAPGNDHVDSLCAKSAPWPQSTNPYPPPYLPFDAGTTSGHEADRVRWVQWALNRPTTGVLDDGDTAAVLAFKRAHHLTVDPIIRQQAFDLLKAIHR